MFLLSGNLIKYLWCLKLTVQLCELNVGKLLPLASLLENHDANLWSALESKMDLLQRLRAATYGSLVQD